MVRGILPEADGGLSQCHRTDKGADTQPAKPLNEISMKKIVLFAITVLTTTVASAETGAPGISDAADGVVSYMPYVRALCYVIAAIIAIVGAVAVYYSMQTSPQNTTKRIAMTAGGALTFVCLSLALPQFFGIDDSVSGGSSSNRTSSIGTRQYTSNGTSFLVSDEGGISQTGIQVSIPELNDGAWITIPTQFSGTSSQGYVNTFIDYYSRTGGNMETMSREITKDYQNAREWYASGKTYSDFMACMIILEQNKVKTVIH